MRVRMHSTYATPNASADPGQIINLPRDVAKDLCDKGYASPADAATPHRRRPTSGLEDRPPAKANVKNVLAWVDGDPQKATTALTAELDRTKPRTGLLDTLTEIAAAGEEE